MSAGQFSALYKILLMNASIAVLLQQLFIAAMESDRANIAMAALVSSIAQYCTPLTVATKRQHVASHPGQFSDLYARPFMNASIVVLQQQLFIAEVESDRA